MRLRQVSLHAMILTVFAICGVIAAAGAFGAEDPFPDGRERLEKSITVGLQLDGRLYSGLPAVAQLRVTNVAPPPAPPFEGYDPAEDFLRISQAQRNELQLQRSLSRRLVPVFTPFTSHPLPISVSIANAAGGEVVAHEPAPYIAFYERPRGSEPTVSDAQGHLMAKSIPLRPRVQVGSGETRTWIFDLSPWIDDLEPGTYSLNVRLYNGPGDGKVPTVTWQSPTVTFQLTSLSEDQWKLLRAAGPVDGHGRFAWLTAGFDIALLAPLLPPDAVGDIAFYPMLGRVASGAANVPPPELVELLPEDLRPVADVVLYELRWESGDEEAAAQIRERFEKAHPELLWLIDRATAGDGLVSQAREILVQSEEPDKDQSD